MLVATTSVLLDHIFNSLSIISQIAEYINGYPNKNTISSVLYQHGAARLKINSVNNSIEALCIWIASV